MTRLIIPALVALIVSVAVWDGQRSNVFAADTENPTDGFSIKEYLDDAAVYGEPTLTDRMINVGASGAVMGALFGALAILITAFRGGFKKFASRSNFYKRKIILLTALASSFGMGLFPPWRFETNGPSVSKGHAFILRPPEPTHLIEIDLTQLLYQWGLIMLVATFFIVLINRDVSPEVDTTADETRDTK